MNLPRWRKKQKTVQGNLRRHFAHDTSLERSIMLKTPRFSMMFKLLSALLADCYSCPRKEKGISFMWDKTCELSCPLACGRCELNSTVFWWTWTKREVRISDRPRDQRHSLRSTPLWPHSNQANVGELLCLKIHFFRTIKKAESAGGLGGFKRLGDGCWSNPSLPLTSAGEALSSETVPRAR